MTAFCRAFFFFPQKKKKKRHNKIRNEGIKIGRGKTERRG
jgi:hypothetical protein